MKSLKHLLVTLVVFNPAVMPGAAEALNESFIKQELERTQSAPDSVASVSIAAPPEFVFDFLSRRPHDYTSDAVGVEFDHSESESAEGDISRGSIREITMNDGGTLVQRFLIYDAPVTYAYLTDMENSTVSAPLNYIITRYELSELTGGGTDLQISLVYEPSSRLLAFLVRQAFRSALTRDFERAAGLIEEQWQK